MLLLDKSGSALQFMEVISEGEQCHLHPICKAKAGLKWVKNPCVIKKFLELLSYCPLNYLSQK